VKDIIVGIACMIGLAVVTLFGILCYALLWAGPFILIIAAVKYLFFTK
jgi:hypothetical protein